MLKTIATFLLITLSLCVSAKDSLKVVTYNLGLAHTFVPLAEERLPELGKALANSDADILCLQEVWEKKDRKKIAKAVEKTFPNVYFEKIKNIKSERIPSCKISELLEKESLLVVCKRIVVVRKAMTLLTVSLKLVARH